MDFVGMWVGLFGTMAAIASAVFAFVQAKAATDAQTEAQLASVAAREARDESARLAAEANEAFRRQAEAQEEANRLRREELTPPDWTGPTPVRGDVHRMVNSSRHTIVVDQFEVAPDGAESMVDIDPEDGGRFEAGDSFEFAAFASFAGSPKKLTVNYHIEGEGDRRSWVIPL